MLAIRVLDRTLSQGPRKPCGLFVSLSVLMFSCSILNANIGYVVDLPCLNPNWLFIVVHIAN